MYDNADLYRTAFSSVVITGIKNIISDPTCEAALNYYVVAIQGYREFSLNMVQ